jgi:hypothetical protein
VRAGQFLRALATSGGASRVFIISRLLPAELETPMGHPIAAKRLWRPFVIGSLVASIGLLAAPVGRSVTWAASAAASAPPVLTVPTPTTLDSYLAYVEDLLNVEAMQMPTPAVAEVRLTIGKDGAVRQADIAHLAGPAALCRRGLTAPL